MIEICMVGLGGFFGAVLRYGISAAMHQRLGDAFPLGTLSVNVAGCLVIGALIPVLDALPNVSPHVRLFLVVGILGAFTTFSTFGFDTLQLIQKQSLGAAALNVAANLVLGLVAVSAGALLGAMAVRRLASAASEVL